MDRLSLIVVLLITPMLSSAETIERVTEFHLSSGASPGGDGRAARPFVTLEQAREAVRKVSDRGDGVYVIIHEGLYKVSKTFTLGPEDSGSQHAPVVYRAAKGEKPVFFGGDEIKQEWFQPLQDRAIASRLTDPSAAKHILVADLKAHGITDYGTITRHGWSLEPPDRIAPAWLSIGGERMTLARWPNAGEDNEFLEKRARDAGLRGMVSYTKVIDPGPARKSAKDWWLDKEFTDHGGTIEVPFDRMKHWSGVGDIWLDGVLSATWEWTYNRVASVDIGKRTITLGSGERAAIGVKKKVSHFYFDNVIEEIDTPGEYTIDRERGLLYLYPPADFAGKSVIMSTLNDEIITMNGAKWITIEGLTFDTGRNNCLSLTDCEDVTIADCRVSNFAMGGFLIDGKRNTVRDCHIHDLGAFGVMLGGGDLVTLERGDNVIENCLIHDIGLEQKSQIPALYITGVGNTVRHNEIHDTPHFAIRMRGCNDCVVEFNEIRDLPYYHKFDGGSIYVYTSNNPEQRGNVIRHNYFHDIPSHGVYIDNYTMGVLVERNVLHNVGNFAQNFMAIQSNSGGQNVFRNNVTIDCDKPISLGDFAAKNVYGEKLQGLWDACIEKYGAGKIEQTPHAKYDDFKVFLGFKAEKEFRYQASDAHGNLMFNPTVPLHERAQKDKGILNRTGMLRFSNNWQTDDDPGFVDWRNGDFRLREDASVFDAIPGFEPIDLSLMGRVNDEN